MENAGVKVETDSDIGSVSESDEEEKENNIIDQPPSLLPSYFWKSERLK